MAATLVMIEVLRITANLKSLDTVPLVISLHAPLQRRLLAADN